MKILVINAGSSSLKFQLFDMTDESVLAKGVCDRIGIDGKYTQKNANGKVLDKVDVPMANHTQAFEHLVKSLSSGEYRVIDSTAEISAVGHRAVHGGEKYSESVLITEQVIKDMEELALLAPLHNPPGVAGIRGCLNVFGTEIPQVAVFDTAFHQTMPASAYMYAIPYEFYEKYKVRRYGFHGTSHRFVTARCAELMGKPASELKIVTCHLGNGSSITAVDGGKSVDTTMGLTPLEGVVMGTRCGSIDPSIVTFLQKKEGLSADEIDTILNKKSGMAGLSGVSSDDRDIRAAIAAGNKQAEIARDVQSLSVAKATASMAASMNGVDAIVFTGGIGENAEGFREAVCDQLSFMGICIDKAVNDKSVHGVEAELSTAESKIKVYVIPTNEELMIARDTMRLAK